MDIIININRLLTNTIYCNIVTHLSNPEFQNKIQIFIQEMSLIYPSMKSGVPNEIKQFIHLYPSVLYLYPPVSASVTVSICICICIHLYCTIMDTIYSSVKSGVPNEIKQFIHLYPSVLYLCLHLYLFPSVSLSYNRLFRCFSLVWPRKYW